MSASIDLYAVIGHPVAHSRSPAIHAAFAAATGQTLRYERVLAPLDGFAQTLADFADQGGLGCNVTVPFKFEAFAAAAERSERAELAGAVNTLQRDSGRWLADNTDGVGLVRDIVVNAGVPLAGRRVLLIGAGGAGAGVLGPLLAEGPAQLVLANRSLDKAQTLVARHTDLARRHGSELRSSGLEAPGTGFDVVLNATASSLGGGEVPVPASVLKPGALALDLMYGPAARPFLAWATRHGATGRDGLGMLVEQAAESFAWWRGVRPPTADVLATLRAEVDATQGH
ncbi:shikimate dehydrogenase [Ideonella sp. B508-1]|uniref:shikimate dehydrogenase n=1 Tax=Ideonella sp. B508-1 TaxID=137716 RepID=UPI00034B34AC|nr:shikimate dehydrogenase [Ideonella sp. B508-1]